MKLRPDILTSKLAGKEAGRDDYRRLLSLGWPVMITQLGIIVVSFADTIMVGAYGTDELAASAFVNNLFLVPMVMLIGFAGGVTPLVGALFSRGANRDIGLTLKASLQINGALALLFTLAMGILYFFVGSLGQPEDILPLIRSYYLIILCSLIFVSLFNCCQQTANGITDTAMPMWIVLGMNVLNVVGNYMLIFGHFGMPEMGLAGAGISTLAARVAGTLAIIATVACHRRYRPFRKGLTSRESVSALRRRVWITSYPVMIQSGVECALWSFGAIVSGWFGKFQLAAYQVVNTISQLGFMTFMSFGVATSVRVANFTGVRDINGIRRTLSAGLRLNIALGTIASIIFLAGGAHLLGLFTNNTEVVAVAVTLIPPLVLYQYGDAIQLTYANAQRGTSVVKPLLWISLIGYCAVGIPLLLLLAKGFGMGVLGVYYSFSGALFTVAILLRRSFRRTVRNLAAEG